jgi:hypothetical protein
MTMLRESAEGTPPGHASRVALKKAEERLAELVKQVTRRDPFGYIRSRPDRSIDALRGRRACSRLRTCRDAIADYYAARRTDLTG